MMVSNAGRMYSTKYGHKWWMQEGLTVWLCIPPFPAIIAPVKIGLMPIHITFCSPKVIRTSPFHQMVLGQLSMEQLPSISLNPRLWMGMFKCWIFEQQKCCCQLFSYYCWRNNKEKRQLGSIFWIHATKKSQPIWESFHKSIANNYTLWQMRPTKSHHTLILHLCHMSLACNSAIACNSC